MSVTLRGLLNVWFWTSKIVDPSPCPQNYFDPEVNVQESRTASEWSMCIKSETGCARAK